MPARTRVAQKTMWILQSAPLGGCALGLLLATGCQRSQPEPVAAGAPVHEAMQNAGQEPGPADFYTAKVLPIFKTNCYRCHGGLNHRGGLQINTFAGMMKGGHDGAVLVPGHPEQSLLIKLIRHEGPKDDPMPMPPKSKLSDADIATVTEWVKDGAKMPQ